MASLEEVFAEKAEPIIDTIRNGVDKHIPMKKTFFSGVGTFLLGITLLGASSKLAAFPTKPPEIIQLYSARETVRDYEFNIGRSGALSAVPPPHVAQAYDTVEKMSTEPNASVVAYYKTLRREASGRANGWIVSGIITASAGMVAMYFGTKEKKKRD